MEYLTWEMYKKNAERHGTHEAHWSSYKIRWQYHKRAIEIIKSSGTKGPHKVLEMGTMGASLVIGSDTIDYNGGWWFHGKNPTYLHDARQLPWPIGDKQYEWFIALRVFQHLNPVQKECFEEARRIASNVLLVVPAQYEYWGGKGITLKQFIAWNNGKPPAIVEHIHNNTYLYCWVR